MSDFDRAVQTSPPAKLNLFLELLAKREDGFHEIDTVMIPIDLRDEMKVWRTTEEQIQLRVRWLPSKQIVAQRLGVDEAAQLLQIPEDETNLVCRALSAFKGRFGIQGGFGCDLQKRIPAGAGMGGASSDAASALLSAAELCAVPKGASELLDIAASLGSDIPFFMGIDGKPLRAARAQGRGELINSITVNLPLHFVLVYPNESLSTAKVYAHSNVPAQPGTAEPIIAALTSGDLAGLRAHLSNRLAQPAKKNLPRIDEILQVLWRSGLPACQLTGSGSTCFAVANNAVHAKTASLKLRSMLEPGAFVTHVSAATVPAKLLPSRI